MKIKHVFLGFNHLVWGLVSLGFNLFVLANAAAYIYGGEMLISEKVLFSLNVYLLFNERWLNVQQGYSLWVPPMDKKDQDDLVIWYLHKAFYWLQWGLVAALFCSIEGLSEHNDRWVMLVVAFGAMRIPLGYMVKAIFSIQAMHSRIVSDSK